MLKLRKLASLGIGTLCLSTAMFMSSCSKEDAAVPQPKIEIAKSDASMKIYGFGNIGTASLANISETNGPTCKGCFAPGWKSFYKNEGYNFLTPAGTSSLTGLWGDNTTPWVVSLPNPSESGLGSIITAASSSRPFANSVLNVMSPVQAEITNLIPGKKYAISVQIATSRIATSQYAKKTRLVIGNPSIPSEIESELTIDLTNIPAQWISKTITFVASSSKTRLVFLVDVDSSLNLSFANIFVGKNAIKLIN